MARPVRSNVLNVDELNWMMGGPAGWIVKTAWLGVPREAPPVGVLRVKLTVTLVFSPVGGISGMATVAEATPLEKVTVSVVLE